MYNLNINIFSFFAGAGFLDLGFKKSSPYKFLFYKKGLV